MHQNLGVHTGIFMKISLDTSMSACLVLEKRPKNNHEKLSSFKFGLIGSVSIVKTILNKNPLLSLFISHQEISRPEKHFSRQETFGAELQIAEDCFLGFIFAKSCF